MRNSDAQQVKPRWSNLDATGQRFVRRGVKVWLSGQQSVRFEVVRVRLGACCVRGFAGDCWVRCSAVRVAL